MEYTLYNGITTAVQVWWSAGSIISLHSLFTFQNAPYMTYNTWRVNRDRINVLQYAFACQPMIIFTTELLCCQHPFPHYPQFTMPEGRVEASPCPMFRHGLQLARTQRVGDGPGLPGVRHLRQGRGRCQGWGARIAQLLHTMAYFPGFVT